MDIAMDEKNEKPIHVTKSFLPPREDFDAYIDQIWDSGILTNNGPLSKRFEKEVSQYLDVDPVRFKFLTNGTLAIQLAIDALGIKNGEIITTPFTYVATISAVLWQRCSPVFVDIDPDKLTIDATKITEAITPNTKAILGVHVFGNPCDIDAIKVIADEHDLKVIYDASHAFGVRYRGRPILEYGDVSTLSFHATKLFHTIEGGAAYTALIEDAENIELLKRFGHNSDEHFQLGINAKANEFQAAMGLANLPYAQDVLSDHKRAAQRYRDKLEGVIKQQVVREGTEYNYSYFPAIFTSEEELKTVVKRLGEMNVFPRRYFFPSLNTLRYVDYSPAPVSEDISRRILCLPMHFGIEEEVIDRICATIKEVVCA